MKERHKKKVQENSAPSDGEKVSKEYGKQTYTISQIVNNPIQLVFLLFAICSALLLLPFTYYGYIKCMENYNNAPKDYEYPVISDLYICAIHSQVFVLLLKILSQPLTFLLRPICKGQDNPQELNLRSKKAGTCLAKGFYMMYAASFGYYVLKDTEFMPTYLGGKGDYSLLYDGGPYQKKIPLLKEYYISCTSYHLGMLTSHLFAKR